MLFNFSCHGTAHTVPAARWICGDGVYHHGVIQQNGHGRRKWRYDIRVCASVFELEFLAVPAAHPACG